MGEPFKIDRKTEAENIRRNVAHLTPDPTLALRVFVGARRIVARQWQRSPNWVVAMELYGVGSTYAWAICERLGIDGDARSAKPCPASGIEARRAETQGGSVHESPAPQGDAPPPSRRASPPMSNPPKGE